MMYNKGDLFEVTEGYAEFNVGDKVVFEKMSSINEDAAQFFLEKDTYHNVLNLPDHHYPEVRFLGNSTQLKSNSDVRISVKKKSIKIL